MKTQSEIDQHYSDTEKMVNRLTNGIQANFAKDSLEALKTHTDMMKLHFKAIGCHCEVMGMMSENMLSACEGSAPMFGILHFREVMHRWGMTDQKGEPVI